MSSERWLSELLCKKPAAFLHLLAREDLIASFAPGTSFIVQQKGLQTTWHSWRSLWYLWRRFWPWWCATSRQAQGKRHPPSRDWSHRTKSCCLNHYLLVAWEAFFVRLGNLGDLKAAGSLHEFLTKLHGRFGDIVSFWIRDQFCVSISTGNLFKEVQVLFDRPCRCFSHEVRKYLQHLTEKSFLLQWFSLISLNLWSPPRESPIQMVQMAGEGTGSCRRHSLPRPLLLCCLPSTRQGWLCNHSQHNSRSLCHLFNICVRGGGNWHVFSSL